MSSSPSPLAARHLFLWVFLPSLVLWLGHVALMGTVQVPQKGDELVYLGNARYLATGEGLVDATGRDPYKVGYSLLLIPAFWVDASPLGGFAAAQWVNSVLLTAVYPLLFFLARCLAPQLTTRDQALAALAVACYPAVWLYGTTAMAENAFLPLFVAVTLMAYRCCQSDLARDWGLLAFLVVFLYYVHERALGVLMATALLAVAMAVWNLRLGTWRRGWLAFPLVAVLTYVGIERVEVPGSVWQTGERGSEFLGQAVILSNALPQTFIGHLWYLLLASFGGLLWGWGGHLVELWTAWRSPTQDADRNPRLLGFWLWLLAAAGSVVVISILFLAPRGYRQFTLWVHGRYAEGVLLPLLLVAVLASRSWWERAGVGRWTSWRAWMRPATWWPLGLSLGVGLTLTLILDAMYRTEVGWAYSFSSVSLPFFSWPAGPGVLRNGAVFLAVSGMLGCLFVWRWRVGVMTLGMLFLVSTGVTLQDSWIERADSVAQQHQLADLVRRIDPPRKVILRELRGKSFHFHHYNLSYFLPDYQFSIFGRKVQDRPPGDLVLSNDIFFDQRHPGARLLGEENMPAISFGYRQSLWVLPGRFQNTLQRRGFWDETTEPAATSVDR